MLKIIRYSVSICLIIISIIIFKNKKNRKRLLKLILGIFSSIIILMMPFENLFLKFNNPEQAFNYAVSNCDIIKTVKTDRSALIIYNDSGSIKATLINNYNGEWKALFLPNNQMLSRLGYDEIILITRERHSNNFYIMISVGINTKQVSDNQNSNFEIFLKNDYWTHYVAYVKNYEGEYIIDLDGEQYKIEI